MPTSSAASSAADRGRVAGRIERRIADLGLELPEPVRAPAGVALPFPWVRRSGARAFVSGHGPQNPDGTLAPPFGKVGAEVSPAEAAASARLVALSALGGLKPSWATSTASRPGCASSGWSTPRRVHRHADRGQRLQRADPRALGPRGRGPHPLGDRRGRASLRRRSRWRPRSVPLAPRLPAALDPAEQLDVPHVELLVALRLVEERLDDLPPRRGAGGARDSARTLAWLYLRAMRAVSASTQRAARAPGTLLAAIEAPVPDQQQTTPRSAAPSATRRATAALASTHSSSPPPGGRGAPPRARRRAGPPRPRRSAG